MTAFHIACSRGHPDVVKIFLQYAVTLNIDLNVKDKDGNTAFHLACQKTACFWESNQGHSDVVKILIENAVTFGVDLNTKNNNNLTGFQEAC